MMMNKDALMSVVAMANTIAAQANTMSAAIIKLIADDKVVQTKKVGRILSKSPKAKKVVRKGKKRKAVKVVKSEAPIEESK